MFNKLLYTNVFFLIFIVESCNSNIQKNNCGDNFIDYGEECDGNNLGGHYCQDKGYYGGDLNCNTDCTLNYDHCTGSGFCGDGVLQANYGEECENNNFGTYSCESLGYTGGKLKCKSTCKLDTGECEGESILCGNGIIDPGEECDSTVLDDNTCENLGYTGGDLVCDSTCKLDTSECEGESILCGNGIIDPIEECDGTNVGNSSCESLGYYRGILKCSENCTFDVKLCSGRCGDGIIDPIEECDGTNIGVLTCENLGYTSGTLVCDSTCKLDTGECEGIPSTCGNNTIDSGEECDGSNLNGHYCQDRGYYGGNVSCNSNCTLNYYNCMGYGWCGDGVIQTSFGEICEVNDVGMETCENYGYYGGTLKCSENCHMYDFSECGGKCGDGVIQTSFGEICDGTNVNNSTCADFGYYVGTPNCNDDCHSMDFSLCEEYCGDNIVQTSYEECDGSDFSISTNCPDYGDFQFDTITLCDSDCIIELSECKIKWSIITAGQSHTCGVKVDGRLYCWGDNSEGQLGIGTTIDSTSPTQVGTDTDWATITAGEAHTCGIKVDGRLYCWGDNSKSQLGIGNTTDSTSPIQVGTDTDWATITAGYYHTCGIKTDGRLYCWGFNNVGQLGIGNTIDSTSPTQVGTDTDWVFVIAVYHHTCGVKVDGRLYCWGDNSGWQLGTGDTMNQHSPAQVGTDTDWISVTTGYYHTCGLKDNNTLYCWGINSIGQLGTGNTTDSTSPTQVGTDTNWISVTAGYHHTCGIKTDGRLYCWGANFFGQLGTGDTADRTSPIQVGTDTNWVFITASRHTCVIKTDGALWGWGKNKLGQLGIESPNPLGINVSPSRIPY